MVVSQAALQSLAVVDEAQVFLRKLLHHCDLRQRAVHGGALLGVQGDRLARQRLEVVRNRVFRLLVHDVGFGRLAMLGLLAEELIKRMCNRLSSLLHQDSARRTRFTVRKTCAM